MINRADFNNFVDLFDKKFFAEQIIDLFFAIFEDRITMIRRNVADRNFPELVESAHSIKSASGNFWDPVSLKDAETLVQMAREGQADGLDEAFQRFEQSMRLLLEELKVIRKELTS